MVKRLSYDFFICAAFLVLFGLVGFGGASSGPAPVDLGLAAVVLGAGFYLWSGTDVARLVGMSCLGLVIAVGAVSFLSGHYMPGTIVAGFGLARLAGGAAAFGSRAAAPAVPSSYGQPQSPYAPPQYAPPQYGYGQPQHGPQQTPSTVGDPRFGAPVPGQAPPAAGPYAPPA
jgi:hypothetical protein